MVELETDDPVEKVVGFYERELTAKGLSVTKKTVDYVDFVKVNLNAEDPASKRAGYVSVGAVGPRKTDITLDFK